MISALYPYSLQSSHLHIPDSLVVFHSCTGRSSYVLTQLGHLIALLWLSLKTCTERNWFIDLSVSASSLLGGAMSPSNLLVLHWIFSLLIYYITEQTRHTSHLEVDECPERADTAKNINTATWLRWLKVIISTKIVSESTQWDLL